MTTRPKTLALETSTRRASIALMAGHTAVAGRTLPSDADTARELTPALSALFAEAGWRARDVELIGVSIGPGSFTGLRIGVTTAKALAYVTGADVGAIDTLLVISAQVPGQPRRIRVVSDAGRGEAYTATYSRADDGTLRTNGAPAIVGRDAWLASLDPHVVQTGSALRRWLDASASDTSGKIVTDAELWIPRAETVGTLALAAYASGQRDDPLKLAPKYVRRPAAEEVWEAKRQGKPAV